MVNVHKKTSALLCVIVGIVLLIGIMSGCTPSHNKEVDTVTLTTNIEMKSDLQNVAQNGAIINSASFNIKETSKDVFVRANVRYYVDREMTNEDRKFLTSINYDGIETISGTGYKWARGSDGYYYLVNSNTGLPFKVNGADTTEYKLCENVVYKGVKSIGETRAPKELKLKVELQAINAKNITATTLEGVALKFKDFFGNNDTLGYIVTFNANGATNPPAQVFLDNNSTVTCPETPSKVGYIFEGWYTDSNYNTEYTFTNTVTNSFTLYAKFVEGKKVTITKGDNIESVTVTVTTNGETIKSGDLVPVGATLTISVTATSGCIASWTVTNGTTTESANATSVTVKGDVTINAVGEIPPPPYTFGQISDTESAFNGYYYVDMGTYPQTLYTGSDEMTQVSGETYTLDGTPCNVYTDGTDEYVQFESKYYKVEPVRWLILGYGDNTGILDGEVTGVTSTGLTFSTDGQTKVKDKGLLVLSEKVLVHQVFDDYDAKHSDTNSYNDWRNSTIHTFMNGTFMNDLFTTDAQDYLTPQTLRTSYYSGGMKTGSDADTSTGDKLFLLSCTYSDEGYGEGDSFILQQTLKVGTETNNMDHSSGSQTILKAQGTGLAFATGCDNSSNYTYWWLRTGSCDYAGYGYCVYPSGRVSDSSVPFTPFGVRPAFVLKVA